MTESPVLRHVYTHRIRYRECDPMGLAYHTHALDWFEYARTEALRSTGLPYRILEENGIIMPVVEASIRYHSPVYYDDVIDVETLFVDMPRVRVPIEYRVRREGQNDVLVSGKVTLCFVDREKNHPISAPNVILRAFSGDLE